MWDDAANWQDRLLIIALALVISWAMGGLLHPKWPQRQWVGFLTVLARKLNRHHRSSGTLVYRGMMYLLFSLFLMLLFTLPLQLLHYITPWAAYLHIIIIAYLLPTRYMWDHSGAMVKALEKGKMLQATERWRRMARQSQAPVDTHGYIRTTIEYMAKNSADQIIAPIMAYLLLGITGFCSVLLLNALDRIAGHRSSTHIAFGWASAKLDDLIQWVPARITALLYILLAFFLPGGKPLKGLITLLRDGSKTRSPNAGKPIAAVAGILNISLAGPRKQGNYSIADQWVGKGTAKAPLAALKRMRILYACLHFLLLLGFTAAYSLTVM